MIKYSKLKKKNKRPGYKNIPQIFMLYKFIAYCIFILFFIQYTRSKRKTIFGIYISIVSYNNNYILPTFLE